MESFLIALLVLTLFLEYGSTVREQFRKAITSNYRGVIKYFGSAAVLSLTLSFLPGLLLSIYMRHYSFFAYEIFSDQQHAIQILSVNVLVNFLLLSVYLFSTALLWGAKADKVSIGVSVLVTLVVMGLFIVFAASSGRYDLFFSIFIFSLLLGGYLYFWVSGGYSGKAKFWWVPLAFSLAFIMLPITFSHGAMVLTENALFQMRVGGINVELSEPLGFRYKQPETLLSAKLLLRTPEFYYLKPHNNPNSILIVRTEHVSLRYPENYIPR